MEGKDDDRIKDLIVIVNALRVEMADNTRKTEQILKGFPASDTDGHRRYHEEVMQELADRRKLRQELISHLLKGSSWAALIGFSYVLWNYAIATLAKFLGKIH